MRRTSLAGIAGWTAFAAVALAACGGPVTTSSPPVIAHQPSPVLRAALAAWSNFPATASKRPIVILDGDDVNAPAHGFTDDALKEAFLEGALAGPASYPRGPSASDDFELITPQQALTILKTPEGSGPPATVNIQIAKVVLSTDNFQTDRGNLPLPAWQFWMQGVQNPANVLAISPKEMFTPPPSNNRPLGVGGGTIGADDRSLLLTFVGPPAGMGPCEANYVAASAESASAVAVSLRAITSPKYKNVACDLVAVQRHLTIRLLTALRGRVLVDASSLMAVPVTKGSE